MTHETRPEISCSVSKFYVIEYWHHYKEEKQVHVDVFLANFIYINAVNYVFTVNF